MYVLRDVERVAGLEKVKSSKTHEHNNGDEFGICGSTRTI